MNDAKAAVKKAAGGSTAKKAAKKEAAPKKKAAAPKKQAAIADLAEPSQEAIVGVPNLGVKRKHARVDHEASRCCWRVRFPDGTSKGFRYKSGEPPLAMRQQAEDYARECGFLVVE